MQVNYMKSEIKKTALLRMYARSIFAICFTFVLIISFAGGMPVETEAQTASAPVILPVDYSGAVDTSGTAQWYADQGEYEVIIGGLPSSAGATNQLLNIYLANPQNNHRFLILSTPPTANATDTYSLPLSQVSKMPPGKYELILVYTFSDGQSESFTATSPASVRIGPSQSSSSNQSANLKPCSTGCDSRIECRPRHDREWHISDWLYRECCRSSDAFKPFL
jgi:hypothetical protein